ncbi:Hypothetical predicted protein [Cloeon dipterum]|uniref:Bee-milk protein n=1 Tax=Cloeon dipterum TaxID=197152 RepID=A0A8S1DUN5_9INSE|nr:Hypothetical predicted protein [Cloeon dipterum]
MLVLSPILGRQYLYFSSFRDLRVYSLPVFALENGLAESVTPSSVGYLSRSPSKIMIDSEGKMYYVVSSEKYIRTWDTNVPQKEEVIFQEDPDQSRFYEVPDSSKLQWSQNPFCFERRLLRKIRGFKCCTCNTFVLRDFAVGFLGETSSRLLKTKVGTKSVVLTGHCNKGFGIFNLGLIAFLCFMMMLLALWIHIQEGKIQKMTCWLFVLVMMVGISKASVNFTTVFEWDTLDFIWPSEKSLLDRNTKPKSLIPDDLVIYNQRVFISLSKGSDGVPASLAWLSTDSPSISPKLNPYPSWKLHEKDNCNSMQEVRGLEVDPMGRLWAIDVGSAFCPAKLWIFDLTNGDSVFICHQFPQEIVSRFYSGRWMHDLALDEGLRDSFAYIPEYITRKLIVFSLKRKSSRAVEIPGINFNAVALSPIRERQFLFLGAWNSPDLYSVPVFDLRTEKKKTLVASLVGKKAASSWRMLMDSKGKLYFDLKDMKYIGTWDITGSFKEEVLYKDEGLTAYKWPFSFDFDSCNNLWLLTRNANQTNNFQLLRAAVGAKSYLYDDFGDSRGLKRFENCINTEEINDSTVLNYISTTPASHISEKINLQENNSSVITVLICSNVLCLVSCSSIVLWLAFRQKRMYQIVRYKNEIQQMSDLQSDDVTPRSSQALSERPFTIDLD